MPRVTVTKGRLNSTNFSQFDPNTCSSPMHEGNNLSRTELEKHLLEHSSHIQKVADEVKSSLIKCCDEAFQEFDRAIEECLSKGDFDFPVTIETLEVARGIYKESKKGCCTEAEVVHTIVGNGNNQDNSDSEEQNQVQKNLCEKETDVFKKPAGFARRTRQASRALSKEYQTPKRTGYSRGYNIAKVTPGPDIDRPLSVLRRPVPGEMAVSMNGSPLVTTHDHISVPQMTIPLANGRILTYLANDGLDPDESLCADIDQETQERLAVFYKLLERKMKKYNGS